MKRPRLAKSLFSPRDLGSQQGRRFMLRSSSSEGVSTRLSALDGLVSSSMRLLDGSPLFVERFCTCSGSLPSQQLDRRH